ncbi:hypothetical protein PDESU_02935 [Pontiella desulfatans]|uniref:Peptidyl-Asp metalloendopeptidase n=1 Tax=Pontiella desulfatans TaxID=2750659 RepID=A0A6C2U4D3_PONDE|nr:M12 family metallo-peptidase [Pontiella desulfatans]VGO14374.1 hypothetical protein PDESU_02935 [Pontiella desulfatans]
MKTAIILNLMLGVALATWANEPPPSLFLGQGDAVMSAPMEAFAQRIHMRATTKRIRTAVLNRASLAADALTLNPFADTPMVADKTDIGFTGARNKTWLGNLRDGKGSVALIINGDRISGKIASMDGVFELYPMDDGAVAIVELDQSAFPSCGNDGSARPTRATSLPADAGDAVPDDGPQGDGALGDTPTANRIRILVAYTSSSQAKTLADYNRTMQEHIDLAIAESNQGYANSLVAARLQLACLYETGATETTAIENDVDNFQSNGDGFADEVHTLRNEYDADMCCLIVDGRDTAWCGWAYGFDYTSAANMFQCTTYSCATGNYSFIHEFGHCQGCRHDTDGTLTPFAYGHGFRQGNTTWRTIMAVTGGNSATRLNYWSNPAVNSPVSPTVAMGTAINGANFAQDNESALDDGDATVVNHQTTPVTSVALNGNTVNNDETADKIVTDTLTVGSFTANAGSRVRLISGNKVVLQPGFHARSGTETRIKIGSPLTN